MISRDEILAAYAAGPERVIELVEALVASHTQLSQRVAELEARLNKDSHNSHKPPSSDGPAQLPRRRSRRKRSGKAPGGQPGHPGQTLLQVTQPDAVVIHGGSTCAHCGTPLEPVPVTVCERRQVLDLPEARPQVTEHRSETRSVRVVRR